MLRALTLYCLVLQTCPVWADTEKACERLWAHRGHTLDGAPEGSVEAAQQALKRGAGGTEIDILWVPQRNDFIVAHDQDQADTKPVELFSDWLQALPNDFPVWVDAKNFSQLWPWQVSTASARLHAILEQHQRLDNSIVESRNPWYLATLHKTGVRTLYRTDLKNHDSDWLNQAHAGLAGWLFNFGPFTAISTDWRRYNGPTAAYLGNMAPVYLSTAKTMDGVAPLLKRPEVHVILTNTGIYAHPDC
jgi:hypothetical protein